MRGKLFTGIVVVIALGLSACETSHVDKAPASIAVTAEPDELDYAIIENLLDNPWFMRIPRSERIPLRQCIVKQAALDATAKGLLGNDDAWMKEANARMGLYLGQIREGNLKPFDETCPDVLDKLEVYLPHA